MMERMKRLALGTVQFGLEYGINNSTGKPTRDEAVEMLNFAYDRGIRTFDTARAYGDAEEVVGEFLRGRGLKDEVRIITKMQPNLMEERDPKKKAETIAANLEDSLKRLNRDYVDGYLLHTPEYIRDEGIVGVLCDLKRQGLARNIGVSIYEEEDALYAARLPEVDYIQVPYNILDQRLDRTGFYEIARKNGVTVFARSPFLQGLFFVEEGKIPPHLEAVKGYMRDFDAIIGKYSLSRQQAALLFSYGNDDIDYVVFGVDHLGHLSEDIAIIEGDLEIGACLDELKGRFAGIEKHVIFPSLWKR